jgi:hypothetical protein
MPHRRQRSPGSFRDELGGVIERIVPDEPKSPARPVERHKSKVGDPGELNSRLFESAWRKAD